MDISFHYYAVKSVALAAGYDEAKAQRIASFSEFIDDYNWYAYFRASNIPDYVKAPELDIVYNNLLSIINPVTTGFSDYFDMATLVLPRSQKFTVSPFHFIPQDKQSVAAGDYRAVPAVLDDNSFIANMLNEVVGNLYSGNISEYELLMQLGCLFHTFADTYAHQLFTGYNNQTNSVVLKNVTNNITGEDQTQQYRFWIDKWIASIESVIKTKMPTIGHMAIAHVPDLSHLSFSMEYLGLDGTKHTYARSNTETFLKPCKEIYTLLRNCLALYDIEPNMTWDELSVGLAQGLLFDASKELSTSEQAAVAVLTPHWSSIFPNYSYSYSGDAIKNGFILSKSNDVQTASINGEQVSLMSSAYSDDFYKYSVFADRVLIKLYGNHPRNWLSEEASITEPETVNV